MKTHSLIITLCVLIVGCTARNLGKRSHKEEYIRLMRSMDRYDVFHEECEFAREDRQECGKRTYDETECKLRGCCFEICEGCDAQIPWCFLAKRMINDEQCDVAYEDKDDCGYYGITEQECVQVRECCWRPSPAANDPPCFRRKPELTVRLVNGEETDTSLSGRVEVKYQGEWGTVCDDNFDQNAADVVCRSLGYEFAIPKGYAEYGEGTGNIWLDGLRCRGNEERIEDCSHNGWGSHDCGHYEDAGAICSNAQEEYEDDDDDDEDDDDDVEIEYYQYNYTYVPEYNYVVIEEEGDNEEEEFPWYRLGNINKEKEGFPGKNAPDKTRRRFVSKNSADHHRAMMQKLSKAQKKRMFEKMQEKRENEKRHQNNFDKINLSTVIKKSLKPKFMSPKEKVLKRGQPKAAIKTMQTKREHVQDRKEFVDKISLVDQLREAVKKAKKSVNSKDK